MGVWITVGVSGFILLLMIAAGCWRYHKKQPQTHQADVVDNAKDAAQQSILYGENGTLLRQAENQQ